MAELVEGARLEIAYTLIAYQGFESLSLRHVAVSCISLAATFLQKSLAGSFRSVSFSVKGHAIPLLFACKRTRHASACYRSFSWYKGSTFKLKMPQLSFSYSIDTLRRFRCT